MGAREARPAPLDPRGLSRVDAAGYFGISPTLFDQLVRNGVLPRAKALQGRNIWDRRELDRAFDDLPARADSAQDAPGEDGGWSDARA